MKTIVLLSLLLGGPMADSKQIPNLAVEVKERLVNQPEDAFRWIESQGEALEACAVYDQAVRELYWLEKGAKSLIIVGQAGIEFCLSESGKLQAAEREKSTQLKAAAKTIAYNVAANSWPGWGDEGVAIDAEDIASGLKAAELNLQLAIELDKPKDKVAAAYWLLAAQQMASGLYDEALESLDRSDSFGEEGSEAVLYNKGFRGVIHMLKGQTEEGARTFEDSLEALSKFDNDTAKWYVSHLKTVREIFLKK